MQIDGTEELVLEQDAPDANEAEEQDVQQQVAEPEIDPETGLPIEADEEETPEFEPIEIEYEGKKYQVHPDLKDGILRHADYTRKSQANAEERRAIAELNQKAMDTLQASEEEVSARGQLAIVNQQLAQYAQVDWNALEQQAINSADPFTEQGRVQTLWRQYQQLRDTKGDLESQVNQAVQKRTEHTQQDIARRWAESRSQASQRIKSWTPEVEQQVFRFASEQLGATREWLTQAMTPQLYHGMYLAWMGHQALNKPAKPKPNAVPNVQPSQKVKGRNSAPPTGLDDRLSNDEWQRRRLKQLQDRAG